MLSRASRIFRMIVVGAERLVEHGDAVLRERVGDRVEHRGGGTDRAALADALVPARRSTPATRCGTSRSRGSRARWARGSP